MTQARPALVNDPTHMPSPAPTAAAPVPAEPPAVSPELLERLKATPLGVDHELDKQRLEVLASLANAQAAKMQAIADSLTAGSPVAGKLPEAATPPAEPRPVAPPSEPARPAEPPPIAAPIGEPPALARALPFATPPAAVPAVAPSPAMPAVPPAAPPAPSSQPAALPFTAPRAPRLAEPEQAPKQSPWVAGMAGPAPSAASQTNPPPAPTDGPSDPKASVVAATGLPFAVSTPSQAPATPPPQTALPAGWLRPQVEPAKPCPIGDVQTYAIFRAWCDLFPDHVAEACTRYGVPLPDGRAEVERAWEARLAADPTELQQFEQLYAYYRDYYARPPA